MGIRFALLLSLALLALPGCQRAKPTNAPLSGAAVDAIYLNSGSGYTTDDKVFFETIALSQDGHAEHCGVGPGAPKAGCFSATLAPAGFAQFTSLLVSGGFYSIEHVDKEIIDASTDSLSVVSTLGTTYEANTHDSASVARIKETMKPALDALVWSPATNLPLVPYCTCP